MTAATRRLWLYGLLLLLPALAVGGLALGLLAREQARLAEREQAAMDSRRAAVETRARLIAENIELLIGDVQSALMATLLDAPSAEPRTFLSDWQASNPLVRDVFRATTEGRLVWGPNTPATRAWLAQDPPWSPAPVAERFRQAAPVVADIAGVGTAAAEVEESAARREISLNVSNYQNARQALQEVAKVQAPVAILSRSTEAKSFAAAASPPAAPSAASAAPRAFMADTADAALGASALADSGFSAAAPTRSGWSTWRDADGLHVFGWRELPDATYVGFELALGMIKQRLGEVFPAPASGEAFELQDDSGSVSHSTRAFGIGYLPPMEVPLRSVFSGWRVLAYQEGPGYLPSSGGDVFALGAALIALLVLAILAAGALLLRQARLSEAEAALKTSFVANVSHELKTPLTTIRLYAELLAQGRVKDEAKRADYLATIGRETQRLGRLVGNVLDFSRLEQGKKRYERASLDLAAELRRLAETHAPRLAEAGLVLRTELPEPLAVATDRDAVEQIVINLLDNACKYAAGGGEVFLKLDASGDGVRVAVADRGPGVPVGHRERIFEKFHRVDERLTAEKSGAGLGLSIARQLARGLGGDLACRERAGGGAEFVLTLPLS